MVRGLCRALSPKGREELVVAVGADDGRFDCADVMPVQFIDREINDFGDTSRTNFGTPHDAARTNLATFRLELRLYQQDCEEIICKKRDTCGKHLRQRNE